MTQPKTTDTPSQFAITQHKGVRITFSNGYAISIQWGPGNYCDNYNDEYYAPQGSDWYASATAEIAILDDNGLCDLPGQCDQVMPRLTSDEVGQVIVWLMGVKKGESLSYHSSYMKFPV